jgi:hypothetical protein
MTEEEFKNKISSLQEEYSALTKEIRILEGNIEDNVRVLFEKR